MHEVSMFDSKFLCQESLILKSRLSLSSASTLPTLQKEKEKVKVWDKTFETRQFTVLPVASLQDVCSTPSTGGGIISTDIKSLQYKTLQPHNSKGCFLSPTLTDRSFQTQSDPSSFIKRLKLKKHIAPRREILRFGRAFRGQWHRDLLIVEVWKKC